VAAGNSRWIRRPRLPHIKLSDVTPRGLHRRRQGRQGDPSTTPYPCVSLSLATAPLTPTSPASSGRGLCDGGGRGRASFLSALSLSSVATTSLPLTDRPTLRPSGWKGKGDDKQHGPHLG
jgi:hypothetical protein